MGCWGERRGDRWRGGEALGTEAQRHRGVRRGGVGASNAGFHRGEAESRRSDGGGVAGRGTTWEP